MDVHTKKRLTEAGFLEYRHKRFDFPVMAKQNNTTCGKNISFEGNSLYTEPGEYFVYGIRSIAWKLPKADFVKNYELAQE